MTFLLATDVEFSAHRPYTSRDECQNAGWRWKSTDDGSIATGARISPYGTHSLAIAPDGSFYLAEYKKIRKIGPAFPGVVPSDIKIASEDGSLIYHFSREGQHLSTVEALTGIVLYQFTYGSHGYVTAITDLDGEVTTIERTENGLPKAIIAPDGQRTRLALNNRGYLQKLVNPAGETYRMAYTDDGLLTQFTTPRGLSSRIAYDDLGRLIYEENPAGGSWSLAREKSNNRYDISLTTALGRTSRYSVISVNGTTTKRLNTAPNGTITETDILSNGTTIHRLPDGTRIIQKQGPDPRFGMLSPVVDELTIQLPSGLTASVKEARQFVAGETISRPESVTYSTTYNGSRLSKRVYDRASKTITSLSAAGRQSVSYLDDKGRIVRETVPGLTDVYYVYDNRGRLTTVIEGQGDDARALTISYDSNSGYVAQITSALQRTVEFSRDVVGRVLVQKLPDARQIEYQYDLDSNLIALKPPGRPEHQYAYDEVSQPVEYQAPDVGLASHETFTSYNLDQQITRVTRPDNQVIDFNYSSGGELAEIVLPKGTQTYTYDAVTRQITTVADEASSMTLSYHHDGPLLLKETWAGNWTGSVNYSYNQDFRIKSYKINDLAAIDLSYDADGLMTQAGDLILNRDADNGLLKGTLLGKVRTE
ncbi:MAG: hypothetical protein DRR19_22980, partial [Candidatus Parabeggiatoa sp. nov. 1]